LLFRLPGDDLQQVCAWAEELHRCMSAPVSSRDCMLAVVHHTVGFVSYRGYTSTVRSRLVRLCCRGLSPTVAGR
jgi:hypothetical protein